MNVQIEPLLSSVWYYRTKSHTRESRPGRDSGPCALLGESTSYVRSPPVLLILATTYHARINGQEIRRNGSRIEAPPKWSYLEVAVHFPLAKSLLGEQATTIS